MNYLVYHGFKASAKLKLKHKHPPRYICTVSCEEERLNLV